MEDRRASQHRTDDTSQNSQHRTRATATPHQRQTARQQGDERTGPPKQRRDRDEGAPRPGAGKPDRRIARDRGRGGEVGVEGGTEGKREVLVWLYGGASGRRREEGAYYERERLWLASGRRGILYPCSDLERLKTGVYYGRRRGRPRRGARPCSVLRCWAGRLRGTWGSSGVRVAAAAFGRGGGCWDENGMEEASNEYVRTGRGCVTAETTRASANFAQDFRSPASVVGAVVYSCGTRTVLVSCLAATCATRN